MIMKSSKTVLLAAVLGMTVSASAQFTVHSGGIFDWVISNPTPVGDGSESLVSFILTIVGDATNVPQAFDSRASSLGGINGQLHQEHGPILGAAGETPVNGTTSWGVFRH